ncbi:relaxase/mobilization nuclease [Streptomyces sp. CMB-StM0423]|uniref:relaxase/mobilization nuclease n=1 Tax=Streptomyces sp. CMB-StM0423 TaxID=2059884 RepID=UPI000C7089EF|nr:relaxase/mobilization nuclease [Streptomyces sp. CMB-StM0423]AUH40533.1 relaxase/mobilization nuclease [Streptomyces sp. CMB-StM0423]
MIPRIHQRTHTAVEPLAQALGRPVSPEDGLTEHTVVAYWPGLDDYTQDDEQRTWTSAQWAEHLEDPYADHPYAASRYGDRHAIFHLDVTLAPEDRTLTGPEWAEIAHRLARASGIQIPGSSHARECRWVALQARPGRLDLIASLIRLGGAWYNPPADIARRVSDEARRIEADLRLIPVYDTPRTRSGNRPVPTAQTQLAAVLAQLADEQTGPLAAVRGLVEHTAQRITRRPTAAGTGTAHRLELIARRIHALQQDLDATAHDMTQPTPAVTPAAARPAAHRSQ